MNYRKLCGFLLAVIWVGALSPAGAQPPPPGAQAPLKAIYVQFKVESLTPANVYLGDVWVTPPRFDAVQAGKTLVQHARAVGLDAHGLGRSISPTWKPSDPKMVAVTPAQGDQVEIRVLRAGKSEVAVSADGITKKLAIKADYRGQNISVEISQ